MFLCACTREQLLAFLPRDGVVAEIGTARGQFARVIAETARPRELHLIDPWEHQPEGEYAADINNVDNDTQERRYRKVTTIFADAIAAGRVVVHRAYSDAAVADFADGRFDFVYVDGDHSYSGAIADLRAYAPKLKPDGFLTGHDYSNAAEARQQGFGVVEAVNEFVRESDFDLVLMTLEVCPSYVLARPGPSVARLTGMLLYAGVVVAEIENFPAAGEFVHKAYSVGGRTGVVPTFRIPGATGQPRV